MHKDCLNIYREARDNVKMTRLQASILLNISESTLKTYETGVIVPNDDTVMLMTEIYNNQKLGYIHLWNNSKLVQSMFPELKDMDLPMTILSLQKELNDVEPLKKDIIEVACDGKIDSFERLIWDKSMKELRDVWIVITVLMVLNI